MRPLLYAHRGASHERPENTLPSFRRAADLGADAFELDCHMTADGVIVVSHDPTGSRMCGVEAAIRERPASDVLSWNAGWGFVNERGERPFADDGIRLPRLEQNVSEFPDHRLNIDLKQVSPPIAEAAVDLIHRMGAEARVTLASFDRDPMLRVRAAGYRGATALCQRELIWMLVVPRAARRWRPIAGDAAQLPLRYGPLDFTSRRVIDHCHALGLRVDFWTVNDPDQARALLAAGADGIMTDDPAAIAPVFAALQ